MKRNKMKRKFTEYTDIIGTTTASGECHEDDGITDVDAVEEISVRPNEQEKTLVLTLGAQNEDMFSLVLDVQYAKVLHAMIGTALEMID